MDLFNLIFATYCYVMIYAPLLSVEMGMLRVLNLNRNHGEFLFETPFSFIPLMIDGFYVLVLCGIATISLILYFSPIVVLCSSRDPGLAGPCFMSGERRALSRFPHSITAACLEDAGDTQSCRGVYKAAPSEQLQRVPLWNSAQNVGGKKLQR